MLVYPFLFVFLFLLSIYDDRVLQRNIHIWHYRGACRWSYVLSRFFQQ